MRQAVLDLDEESVAEWGFELFDDAGLRDVEVLSCEGVRGVIRIHLEERPDEERLDDLDSVEWWELVSEDDSEYVYLVEASAADSMEMPVSVADGLPRTERVDVHERGLTIEYAGSQEQISDLVTEFESSGIGVSLQRLQPYQIRNTPLDALTDRQREVLEVAFDSGYYDVPRSGSAKDVASELDLDDSTVSEHLQRGERNLIASVLNRSP